MLVYSKYWKSITPFRALLHKGQFFDITWSLVACSFWYTLTHLCYHHFQFVQCIAFKKKVIWQKLGLFIFTFFWNFYVHFFAIDLSVDSVLTAFLYAFNIFFLLFLTIPCLIVTHFIISTFWKKYAQSLTERVFSERIAIRWRTVNIFITLSDADSLEFHSSWHSSFLN